MEAGAEALPSGVRTARTRAKAEAPPAPPDEPKRSRRDAQRLCHGDRPRRRPPGRGAGSDGAPDPPGRPGRASTAPWSTTPPTASSNCCAAATASPRTRPPSSGWATRRPAALQAEQGQEALTARLVEGYLRVAESYDTVLILGSDFAGTNLPAELGVNARLANECGASRTAGDRRPRAERRVGGRRGPQRLPRVHQPRLRRDRAGRQPGGPGGGRRRGRAAAPRGGPAGVRPAGRARAVRADGPRRSWRRSAPRCCSATTRGCPGTRWTSCSAARCCRPSCPS